MSGDLPSCYAGSGRIGSSRVLPGFVGSGESLGPGHLFQSPPVPGGGRDGRQTLGFSTENPPFTENKRKEVSYGLCSHPSRFKLSTGVLFILDNSVGLREGRSSGSRTRVVRHSCYLVGRPLLNSLPDYGPSSRRRHARRGCTLPSKKGRRLPTVRPPEDLILVSWCPGAPVGVPQSVCAPLELRSGTCSETGRRTEEKYKDVLITRREDRGPVYPSRRRRPTVLGGRSLLVRRSTPDTLSPPGTQCTFD